MAESIPVVARRTRVFRAPDLAPAPDHLTTSSAALWDKIVRTWALGGDGEAQLVLNMENLDLAERLRIELLAEGEVITNPQSGLSKPNPKAALRLAAMREFRLGMRALGLANEEA